MANRTECLYNDEIIGIESIYTVVNGKQINIPGKVEELRQLGKKGLLLCTCGCGTRLSVVAGERNLREQHFRVWHEDNKNTICNYTGCDPETYIAKVVLKYWLEDNLHKNDIKCNVKIQNVGDSVRHFEYTAFDKDNRIGVVYWKNRANILDEKIDILNQYARKVIYVIGKVNEGSNGQYPELRMKIQNSQGYVLYLNIQEDKTFYESTEMSAMIYEQNIDGEWEEILIADGLIADYVLSFEGDVYFDGNDIRNIIKEKRENYKEEQKRIEEIRKKEEEENILREEQQRLEMQKAENEYLKRQLEWEEKKRIEAEKQQEENRKREEQRQINEKKKIEELLNQQEVKAVDSHGIRWIKCEYCGTVANDSEFSSYGGPNHINLGICKVCMEKGHFVKYKSNDENKTQIDKENEFCPYCGKKLIEKNGRYGKFIGCTGFPQCRFTRKARL